MSSLPSTALDETIELLQKLIQNKCVNPPGDELRSIKTIESYLTDRNISCQVFETAPNRGNLVARINGSSDGSSLMFGPAHVDVVPVDRDKWSVDPFEGVIKDEHVWGRGTLDMLFIVAAQVQAFSQLQQEGFKPKGDLILCVVADEEAGGTYGMEWLIKNQLEIIQSDYALGEAGGFPLADGKLLVFGTGEKGAAWKRLTFRGTPAHGSSPYKSDNAVVKAGLAATRLARYKSPVDTQYIKVMAKGIGMNPIIRLLMNRWMLAPVLNLIYRKNPTIAKLLYSLSRMTISPNIVQGGTKTNIIAGQAHLGVDIRVLPDQNDGYVTDHVKKAIGKKLAQETTIETPSDLPGFFQSQGSTSEVSPEIKDAIMKSVSPYYPDAQFVPMMSSGASDLRFLRPHGTRAYGFSLFDPSVNINEISKLAHGPNERIGIKTIDLTLHAYYNVAKELLG
ncbi:MAG: M20/M25/M40 family metallo-hydrolase [Candidatus Heimdallarchaeota archaeon]